MTNDSEKRAHLVTLLAEQKNIPKSPAVVAAAERQMQRWLLAHQAGEDRECPASEKHRTGPTGPYVTISREAGVGGSQIGKLVGEALGWEVLDRGLLDCMAKRYHTSPAVLELVDETTSNWIADFFSSWFDREAISSQKYVFCLSRVIVTAASQGKVVIVGRGAGFLLPRERGLSVRLIAPEKYRVEQTVTRRGLSLEKAQTYVTQIDRGRRGCARRFFHRDVTDPHLFDLVINVEKFGPEGTACRIVEAFKSCVEQV